MDQQQLVVKAYESFKDLPTFPYHNFVHCVETANRAMGASYYYGVSEDERLALFQAALFHDAGYLGDKDDAVNVRASAEVWGKDDLVRELILSTRSPWRLPQDNDPRGLLKRILHDADILQSATLHWRLLLEEELSIETSSEWLEQNLTTTWGQEYLALTKEGL